ncbi:tape measure protein [Corynebacterium sp. KPL3739]|uniref:tape measure protein n=1 Tax=Corynebacterium sp. KPL3739 TaxID=3158321 RepID=UPI0032EDF9AD
MAGVELANAWVTIIPDTSKIAPKIKSAFGDVEPAVQKKGTSIGTGLSNAMGKALKVGAASVGVAAGAALSGSIAKGFSRLNATSNAEKKLEALGNSATDVAGIMDNALASVKGTAFGIGEAAGTAATMVASGIKPGQELETVLKGVADTASVAGTSMEDMGLIFGKAAAKGKLDGEVVAQLLERQIPVYDILSKKMGVASEDIADMVSKGEVDFKTFSEAMNEYVGGGAQKMAETFDGAFMNMGAAMGRFGETLLKPLYEASPALLSAVGGVFDGMEEAMSPAMEQVGEKLGPAFESFAGIIEDRITPAMAGFAEWLGDIALKVTDVVVDPENWEKLGDAFSSLKDTAANLGPALGDLIGSLAQVSASVSVAVWQALADVLNALEPLISSVLVPLVEKIADVAAQNPGAVQAVVTAFLGFKGLSAIAGPVGSAVGIIKNLGGAAKFAGSAFKGASIGEAMLTLMSGANSANPAVSKMGKATAKTGRGLAKSSMAASATGKAFGGMGKVLGPVGKAFGTIGRAAMKAIKFINPWVAGFALLTGALTWFFTKTEWGQQIWESFTQAIGAGWDWLVEKFQAGIDWIQSTFGPIFSQIGDTISAAWDATVEKITAGIDKVKEIFAGGLEFFQTGETTDLAAAFGLSEDSPIFTVMTFLRDKIVLLKDVAIEAWGLMKEKWAEFTTGFGQFYETWIAPVVDFIGEKFTGAKELAVEAWQAMQDKWSEFTQGFGEFYETWISPIVETMGEAFTVMGEVVSAAWTALGDAVSAVWNGVIKPVFDTFKQVAEIIFPAVASIVGTVVGAAFQIMGSVISTVWNSVIRPAWEVMKSVFGVVADVLTGNFDNLGNRFSELGSRIMGLVTGIFTGAWNLLRSVVTTALNAAGAIVDTFKDTVIKMVNVAKGRIDDLINGFKAMPGKIKGAFANAGSWLLDAGRSIISGLAQGIRNAAGMVENAIRAVIPDNLERFVPGLHLGGVVPAFARGGVLPSVPGISRNERDPILGWSSEKKQPIARVEPGEFIVNREATRKNWRLLTAINGGKVDGQQGDIGLPRYANGGVVSYDQAYRFLKGESINGARPPRPLEGSAYVWGGGLNANWGDCSGTQSAEAALVAGVNTAGRKFATGTQGSWLGQHGFKRGRSPGKNAFETGYFNGGPWGGHTAGTLFDSQGRSVNFEMGGGRGNGQLGGPAAGSRHPQFTDVWWHPLKSSSKTITGVQSTSTSGVTVGTVDEKNKFQAEQIDWGEASKLATDWEKDERTKKNLRRWSAGIFDTGGILKPGNIAINASGKPERVLDPALTVAVEQIAKVSPDLAKAMNNFANVNWAGIGNEMSVAFAGGNAGNKNLAAAVGDRVAERLTGYASFAGAQTRSIQRGDKIGAYLENIGVVEGVDLADRIGSLIGIDGIKSTFGGVASAFEGMESAASAEVDAADSVKQAEKNLARARKEGSPEDVAAAEQDLTKARGAVQVAAAAMGQAQVAMMIELAAMAIKLIKAVFDFIEARIQGVMKAHVDAFEAVSDAMGAVAKLDETVLKLRESVTGVIIDHAMAQIEWAAAAREARMVQMDGITAQLEATKTLAEAQADFDAQRKNDMRLAAMDYTDLSLAYDRFRWDMIGANEDMMDSMAAWSDESHALYSELLAAQVNQQLVEKQAQRANLEASYKHILAVLELNDVTANLEVAAKKLAVASGQAFGMDQVGATVGQRYADLMAEKHR